MEPIQRFPSMRLEKHQFLDHLEAPRSEAGLSVLCRRILEYADRESGRSDGSANHGVLPAARRRTHRDSDRRDDLWKLRFHSPALGRQGHSRPRCTPMSPARRPGDRADQWTRRVAGRRSSLPASHTSGASRSSALADRTVFADNHRPPYHQSARRLHRDRWGLPRHPGQSDRNVRTQGTCPVGIWRNHSLVASGRYTTTAAQKFGDDALRITITARAYRNREQDHALPSLGLLVRKAEMVAYCAGYRDPTSIPYPLQERPLCPVFSMRAQIPFFQGACEMNASLQTESSECGLACIATVAAAHGMHISLAEMRQRFPTSLRGARLNDLIRIADRIGLRARALRLEPEDLVGLQLPCILHWNLNHFVVLTKIKARKLTVFDPAYGERSLSEATVSRHFSGVALELIPSAGFEPRPPRPSVSPASVDRPGARAQALAGTDISRLADPTVLRRAVTVLSATGGGPRSGFGRPRSPGRTRHQLHPVAGAADRRLRVAWLVGALAVLALRRAMDEQRLRPTCCGCRWTISRSASWATSRPGLVL